jgi:hypothetical protein
MVTKANPPHPVNFEKFQYEELKRKVSGLLKVYA